MTDFQSITISPQANLREAISAIDRGARQLALVADELGGLVAVITDGNVRRGLLRGLTLDAPVSEVMNCEPVTARVEDGIDTALRLMRERQLHHMPLVDRQGRVVDLLWIDEIDRTSRRSTPIVLMAGGLGTRLRPLTETVPKPMLPVGGKPILELIIRNFIEQGFYKFTIALNYRGEMICEHFGDGCRFNAEISYLKETKRMGTAGALSFLETRPNQPFIVMNGDLLTSMSFEALLRFHAETEAVATMCGREYLMQVPYGVIELENTSLRRIREKPTYSHLVNAGIYVLSPEALDHVERDTFLDMPTIFERVVAAGANAAVFPIEEYWLDIGRHEDLERARAEIGELGKAVEAL